MTDIGTGTAPSRPRRWAGPALIFAAFAAGTWFFASRPRLDPDAIRRTAEFDLESGRYDQAEVMLAGLPTLGPRDWLLKAKVAKARNHPDEALAALTAIGDGDPLAAQALLMAGQIELRRGRLRAAETSLRAAVRRDPALIPAHGDLIYIFSMQLRRRELAEQFRALARETPLTFDNVFHWCLTRNIVWEPHEHAGHLRKFVEADPTDRWSRVALADSLRQLGRLAEASEFLSVLPDSDPEARAVRARIALDRGDDRSAETLLAGGPADHPELALLRGRFALAHHDLPSAVRHFRAAYEAEPDNRDAMFGLGAALATMGDQAASAPFRKASKAFDTLGSLVNLAANPANRNDPSLMRNLGAACEAVGRLPEAYAWYNLCVRVDPLDPEAQAAVNRLSSHDPKRR